MCERCCPGFLQKKWQPTTAHNNFTCEPCNCFGRSDECVYDEDVFVNSLSLDIHGNYEGGGRCLNCRDFTEGVNCNKCVFGYYRQDGVQWNDTMPCKPCRCDPSKHTGDCEEGTGKCYCQPRFQGDNCDQCAPGYYDPPECKKCECAVSPENGQCPCKPGFGGTFCETCQPGFTNVTAGCKAVLFQNACATRPALHTRTARPRLARASVRPSFSGLHCDSCQTGFYGFPNCTFCNCDPGSRTEVVRHNAISTPGNVCAKTASLARNAISATSATMDILIVKSIFRFSECNCMGAGAKALECDATSGQCPCYANFTARTCDKCAVGFYDYPNCKACSCLIDGAKGQACDSKGQCYCKGNFEGERCDRCKPNFYNFPACEECNCHPAGVTPDFAGCDKVQPGELCSCRKNVDGRICDQCKPTFWDLQYHHSDGCIVTGQCLCKRNAAGRQCEKCADGFYNLEGFNQLGCELPIEHLPEIIGPASYVQTGDDNKVIEATIEVPEDYDYAVVVEYHNHKKTQLPITVELVQEGNVKLNGSITIHSCPFATFCREVVSEGGKVATIPLTKGPATVQLHVPPSADFGLAAINLIAKNEWNNEYLQQVPVCVRKDGRCVPQQYPPAGNSIVAEAEAGQVSYMPCWENPISGEKLPFPIANPKDVVVMPLDESQVNVILTI
ncbi:laminin EGF-like protein [Ostertagia ostertagi]